MTNPDEEKKANEILLAAGIKNPYRLPALIKNQIDFFNLDLSGLTIITEAASGPFVVTPIIACMAGAKRVIAYTKNSSYASCDEVIAQTQALEHICGMPSTIEIVVERDLSYFREADIVTNLGFVRPLDKEVISLMKNNAVIPLMCEAWEIRETDLDIETCKKRGVKVYGTNEDYPGLEVFTNSGNLCAKLLFEAQIEIFKSKILVVSSDKFGVVISRHLIAMGAHTTLLYDLKSTAQLESNTFDAVIIADYSRSDYIIGDQGEITAQDFATIFPHTTLIQFAGHNNTFELENKGIVVYPNVPLSPHKMSQTLAYLSPRPVIELHTAGLKIGEIFTKMDNTSNNDKWENLAQIII